LRGKGCRSTIAAAGLRLKLGDVLFVIMDHVAFHLAVEGASAQALQLGVFGPGLGRQSGTDIEVHPAGELLCLGKTGAMIFCQRHAEVAHLRTAAPPRDQLAKRHLGVIAVDRILHPS
jgi:hypothetical protein